MNGEMILIMDEIHRLNKSVEEVLYPALEDFVLDIVIGKGPSARSIRLDLPKFTLVGATTKAGALCQQSQHQDYQHTIQLPQPELFRQILQQKRISLTFRAVMPGIMIWLTKKVLDQVWIFRKDLITLSQ